MRAIPGTRLHRQFLLLTVVTAGIACGDRQEKAPVAAPAPVFGEHRTTLASKATKELGEECGQHGASECVSGLCLHTQADPQRGYYCSGVCRGLGECPEGWACAQLHPGEATRVCIPPANWQSASVRPRGDTGAGPRTGR